MDTNKKRIIDLNVEELRGILIESIKNLKLDRQSDKFLSTKITLTQLCETYGWAKPTVYSWCSQRRIPHSKLGKQLWFDQNEIEKWISDNRVKTKSQLEEDYESKK